jgi:hypothetical protein
MDVGLFVKNRPVFVPDNTHRRASADALRFVSSEREPRRRKGGSRGELVAAWFSLLGSRGCPCRRHRFRPAVRGGIKRKNNKAQGRMAESGKSGAKNGLARYPFFDFVRYLRPAYGETLP